MVGRGCCGRGQRRQRGRGGADGGRAVREIAETARRGSGAADGGREGAGEVAEVARAAEEVTREVKQAMRDVVADVAEVICMLVLAS